MSVFLTHGTPETPPRTATASKKMKGEIPHKKYVRDVHSPISRSPASSHRCECVCVYKFSVAIKTALYWNLHNAFVLCASSNNAWTTTGELTLYVRVEAPPKMHTHTPSRVVVDALSGMRAGFYASSSYMRVCQNKLILTILILQVACRNGQHSHTCSSGQRKTITQNGSVNEYLPQTTTELWGPGGALLFDINLRMPFVRDPLPPGCERVGWWCTGIPR